MSELIKQPDFVRVYLSCVAGFAGYSSSLNPILFSLLKRAIHTEENEKGEQLIFVTKFLKELVAKECGVSIKRVDQALTELVKSKCFSRIAQGTYSVDVNYFGRVKWKDIQKVQQIQANFEINQDGTKNFKAEFARKEKKERTENTGKTAETPKAETPEVKPSEIAF